MKHFLTLPLWLGLTLLAFGKNGLTVDLITRSDEPIDFIAFFNLDQTNSTGQQQYVDSLRVEFTTQIDDLYILIYYKGESRYSEQMWLEPGTVKVFFEIKNGRLEIKNVTGSRLFYRQLAYKNKLITNSSWDSEEYNRYHQKIISGNANSTFMLMCAQNYMNRNQNSGMELRWLRSRLEALPPEVKNHVLYQSTYKRLTILLKKSALRLTDYLFINEANNKVRIVQTDTNRILLDFWFVECAPCIRDHKTMKTDMEMGKFRSRSVTIIGISRDRDFRKWQAYLAESSLPWDNYKVDSEEKSNIIDDLSITGYPTYILIDYKGNILGNFNRYETLTGHLGF